MVRLRVLGPLALEVDGAEVALPDRRPARALVGWLALHPGMRSRSEIAGTLWPDVLESSARASLRTALSSVRQALGSSGARALIAGREEIGLAGAPEVWVDAGAFDELAAVGRCEDALALCRGELLLGMDDEWVLVARDEHRQRRSDLLAALAEAAEAAGDADAAVRWSRRRVALDRLDEPAHRDLMRALAAVGDRAGAQALCERFQARLRRELAVPPSLQTRRLAYALREVRQDPTHALGPAALVSSRRPAALSLRPPLAARLTLARSAGPFVGRAQPLAQLRAAWARARAGERQLAVIAGEAGIGKTRLAARLAAELHAEGATVLYGRAEEDALLPYHPFVEALLSIGLEAGPAVSEAVGLLSGLDAVEHGVSDAARAASPGEARGARARLFEAVGETLDALGAERPVLLVLDDVQWADHPTLRLLVHVASRPVPARSLVLVAHRHTEWASGDPILDTLVELRREVRVENVALAGLGGDELGGVLHPVDAAGASGATRNRARTSRAGQRGLRDGRRSTRARGYAGGGRRPDHGRRYRRIGCRG